MKEKIKAAHDKYVEAANEFVNYFCRKHEVDFDGWINDEIGIAVFSHDWFISLDNIIEDLINDYPAYAIFDWHDYMIKVHFEDSDKKVNLSNYIKGARIEGIEDYKKVTP